MAKATGTSLQTVITTLKIVEEGNIIKRKTGVLMLKPKLL
ncbi:replication/maintenance protein RepL, partial [Staphylococcus aureus]|nr:replication/maintenance protein RepL [Staphylococcus aureus]